ncbi:MAG: DUF507 family protein [Candidatus Eisenbacteria bacterium]|nr:DUF507 family protein [Candidatus Eisenbacteria bacterium]
MRLSERKIRYLSERIVTWMERRGDVEFVGRPEIVELAVARAVTLELKIEDDLDDEVERVLAGYQNQIRGQNMDMMLLRQKIKSQLAREKGIVL